MINFGIHPVKCYFFLALFFIITTLDSSSAFHREALKVGDWNVSITTNPTQHKAQTANRYRSYRRDDDSDHDPKKLTQTLEEKILSRVANAANDSNAKPTSPRSIYSTRRGNRYHLSRKSFMPHGRYNSRSYQRKAYAKKSKLAPRRRDYAMNRNKERFRDFRDFEDNRNGVYNVVEDGDGRYYDYDREEDDLHAKSYLGNLSPDALEDFKNADDDGDDDDKMSQRKTEYLKDASASVFMEDPETYDLENLDDVSTGGSQYNEDADGDDDDDVYKKDVAEYNEDADGDDDDDRYKKDGAEYNEDADGDDDDDEYTKDGAEYNEDADDDDDVYKDGAEYYEDADGDDDDGYNNDDDDDDDRYNNDDDDDDDRYNNDDDDDDDIYNDDDDDDDRYNDDDDDDDDGYNNDGAEYQEDEEGGDDGDENDGYNDDDNGDDDEYNEDDDDEDGGDEYNEDDDGDDDDTENALLDDSVVDAL